MSKNWEVDDVKRRRRTVTAAAVANNWVLSIRPKNGAKKLGNTTWQ